MSKTVSITAAKRETLGSASARRLRREGLVPAVVYGHGNAAAPITVNPADADKVDGHSGLVEIGMEGGEKKLAVVREIQRHPMKDFYLHIDFQEVKMDEVIESTVPVFGEGEPAGAKQGGQLEQITMEIVVKALPMNLPDSIKVDVSGLEVNEFIHVKDLVLPEGVTAVTGADHVVFQCRIPHAKPEPEAEAAATEEAAAEAAPAEEKK